MSTKQDSWTAERELLSLMDGWTIESRPIIARTSNPTQWDNSAHHFAVEVRSARYYELHRPPESTQWQGEYSMGSALHPPPSLLDVVSSLLIDIAGMWPDIKFRDWCRDYWGKNDGNPADALDTFQACQRSARFCSQAFGDALERAQELAGEL